MIVAMIAVGVLVGLAIGCITNSAVLGYLAALATWPCILGIMLIMVAVRRLA